VSKRANRTKQSENEAKERSEDVEDQEKEKSVALAVDGGHWQVQTWDLSSLVTSWLAQRLHTGGVSTELPCSIRCHAEHRVA
jgi:hypothetical protein